jgi:NTE family protein
MTTALVLCGGAAHGAIEVGLYRALVELGIEFDFIVGTSIGAVNGALIAAGLSPAELAERWRHIRTSDVLDFRRGWLRLLRNAPALCDGWRTEQFIRRLLPFHTFMHLPRRLAIVATDLMTGEAVVLERGDLVEAVLASIALPGLLPPRRYRGRWLIDGGLAANLPVRVAYEMGARRVVAFPCRCMSRPDEAPRGALDVLFHCVSLMIATQMRLQLESVAGCLEAIILGGCPGPDIDPFDFDRAHELIEPAYQAARTQLLQWVRSGVSVG